MAEEEKAKPDPVAAPQNLDGLPILNDDQTSLANFLDKNSSELQPPTRKERNNGADLSKETSATAPRITENAGEASPNLSMKANLAIMGTPPHVT